MGNCKEADVFCDQVGLALRLLNGSWWLIRCDRSKLLVLCWGAQGAGNKYCGMLTGDWGSSGACQLLWDDGCLKVPWSSFGALSMSAGTPQCQLQRRLLSPAACLAGHRLKLESLDGTDEAKWLSCQKKTGTLLSPSGEPVRCSSIRSVAWASQPPWLIRFA